MSGLKLARGGVRTKDYMIVNGKKVYGSYAIRIFEYTSVKFGFEPTFVHGFSGRYNSKNNSWNGIMGKVNKNEILIR